MKADPKHLSLLAAVISSSGQPGSCSWFAERALDLWDSAEDIVAKKEGFDLDSERLEVAAAALLETYPEGHVHAGAYVVAFETFELTERLDELAKALGPFQLWKEAQDALQRLAEKS